eukprot:11349818-Ditylum_brightwellii.AAC.1
MFLHTPHGVLLSVFTDTRSLRGCVESGNIQATRLGNPERQIAANDVIKMAQNNPSYSKHISMS